ncbi:hypothetical protein SS50377_22141 [Spironucleus salmonicida]|uniref:Uncharacterized protein n=1 Tax=Spironucleus salmonicida TaxID=348837 RepID=A0A9P8S1C3_9EUKA|nr:hypothetical protein SS50377_22141 [Spironucleus salmonicida]
MKLSFNEYKFEDLFEQQLVALDEQIFQSKVNEDNLLLIGIYTLYYYKINGTNILLEKKLQLQKAIIQVYFHQQYTVISHTDNSLTFINQNFDIEEKLYKQELQCCNISNNIFYFGNNFTFLNQEFKLINEVKDIQVINYSNQKILMIASSNLECHIFINDILYQTKLINIQYPCIITQCQIQGICAVGNIYGDVCIIDLRVFKIIALFNTGCGEVKVLQFLNIQDWILAGCQNCIIYKFGVSQGKVLEIPDTIYFSSFYATKKNFLQLIKIYNNSIVFYTVNRANKLFNGFLKQLIEDLASECGISDSFQKKIIFSLYKNDFGQLFQICLQRIFQLIEDKNIKGAKEMFAYLDPYFNYQINAKIPEILEKDQSYIQFQKEFLYKVGSYLYPDSVIFPLEIDKQKLKYYGYYIMLIEDLDNISQISNEKLLQVHRFIEDNYILIEPQFLSIVFHYINILNHSTTTKIQLSLFILEKYKNNSQKFIQQIFQCFTPTIFTQICNNKLTPLLIIFIEYIQSNQEFSYNAINDILDNHEILLLKNKEAADILQSDIITFVSLKTDISKFLQFNLKEVIYFIDKQFQQTDQELDLSAEIIVNKLRDIQLLDIKSILFYIFSCLISGQIEQALICTSQTYAYIQQFILAYKKDQAKYSFLLFIRQLFFYVFIPYELKQLQLANQYFAVEQIIQLLKNELIIKSLQQDVLCTTIDTIIGEDNKTENMFSNVFQQIKNKCLQKAGDYDQYNISTRQQLSNQLQTYLQQMKQHHVLNVICQSVESIIIPLTIE